MKICSRCRKEKSQDQFPKASKNKDGLYSYCKDCAVEHATEWNLKNKNRRKEQRRKDRKKYRTVHVDRVRLQKARSKRKRMKTDPSYKLRHQISKRINKKLKLHDVIKNCSIWTKLPYKPSQLKAHLESLWEPWMSWSNYGAYNANNRTWQIDHIIPSAALPFDSLDHLNFIRLWCLENLRPMESYANLMKSDKITYETLLSCVK